MNNKKDYQAYDFRDEQKNRSQAAYPSPVPSGRQYPSQGFHQEEDFTDEDSRVDEKKAAQAGWTYKEKVEAQGKLMIFKVVRVIAISALLATTVMAFKGMVTGTEYIGFAKDLLTLLMAFLAGKSQA